MSGLMELAARCEAATEGDQAALLREAFEVIHGPKPERLLGGSPELTAYLDVLNPFVAFINARAFLDAAMTLVPEQFGRPSAMHVQRTRNPASCCAVVWTDHEFNRSERGDAKTLPLALCAAALRARASTEQSVMENEK